MQRWELCGRGELLTRVSSLRCSLPPRLPSHERLFSEERDSVFQSICRTPRFPQRAPVSGMKSEGRKLGEPQSFSSPGGSSCTILFSRTWRAPSRLLEQTGAVTCGFGFFSLFSADRGHLLYRPLRSPGRDEPGRAWVPVPAPDLPPHGAGVRQTAPQQLAATGGSNPREEEIPVSWQETGMGEQETIPIGFSELGKKTAKAARCVARAQCYVFHLEK